MLKDIGCQCAIIGHSERRQYFGETNETVNKRLKAALKVSLTPIVCIGEVLEEREAEKTLDVIEHQLKEGLKVILDGAITLYKPRGEYQINCFSIEPAGHGALALAYDKVPLTLKSDYESLLNDQSYVTLEHALYRLWISFPQDRFRYLEKTKGIIGLPNKNVRLLWLLFAVLTKDYHNDLKESFEYVQFIPTQPIAMRIEELLEGVKLQIIII